MKKYKQFILENQQYLTEPWDPDFETNFRHNMWDKVKSISNNMNVLADRLGLELHHYSEDKDGTCYWKCKFNDSKGKIISVDINLNKFWILTYSNYKGRCYDFKTLRDVENFLKDKFELKTNENQQYLTEPYDPEEIISFPMNLEPAIQNIKSRLKLIADRLGLEMSVDVNNDLEIYFECGITLTMTIKIGRYNIYVCDYLDSYKTLNDIEERMKKFFSDNDIHLKNENQQYLTDPYDPEEPAQLKGTRTRKNIGIMDEKMNKLSKKLGLKLSMYDVEEKNVKYKRRYEFSKAGTLFHTFDIDLYHSRINAPGRDNVLYFIPKGGTKTYRTMEDIESILSKYFELDTNENQQYLTDPYDPESPVFYELHGVEKYLQLYKNMKNLANHLGIELDEKFDPNITEYFQFINTNNNRHYKFYIRYDLHDLHLKDEDGETSYTTIEDVKKTLVEELWLKTNENQQYLTEPYDPEAEVSMKNDAEEKQDLIIIRLEGLAKKLNLKTNISFKNAYKKRFIFIQEDEKLPFIIEISPSKVVVYLENGITGHFDTLGEIEEVLIRYFDITTNENQQYLTDPYDPDEPVKFKTDVNIFVRKLNTELEKLAKMLGINVIFPTTIGSSIYYVDFYKGDRKFHFDVELDSDGVTMHDQYHERDYNIMNDVKKRLEEFFKLKTNENQSYLTDPYDPEMSLIYKFDNEGFINKIKTGLKYISKKLGLKLFFNEEQTKKFANFYINETGKEIKKYRFCIESSINGIDFYDEDYHFRYRTLGEVEERLREIFEINETKIKKYTQFLLEKN